MASMRGAPRLQPLQASQLELSHQSRPLATICMRSSRVVSLISTLFLMRCPVRIGRLSINHYTPSDEFACKELAAASFGWYVYASLGIRVPAGSRAVDVPKPQFLSCPCGMLRTNRRNNIAKGQHHEAIHHHCVVHCRVLYRACAHSVCGGARLPLSLAGYGVFGWMTLGTVQQ